MERSLLALNSAKASISAPVGYRMVQCCIQCGLSAIRTAASTPRLSSRNTRRCQRPGRPLRRSRKPTRCCRESPHLSGVVFTANKAKRKGIGLVLRTIGAKKAKTCSFRTIGAVLCGMATVTVSTVLKRPKIQHCFPAARYRHSNVQTSLSGHRMERGHFC